MMNQRSLTNPAKKALALALSALLMCTTIMVAPCGYADETADLHKYQQPEYAQPDAKTVFSLRKPSMFDGYKYYYTPLAEERDMYVDLGWEYVGEVETGPVNWYYLENSTYHGIYGAYEWELEGYLADGYQIKEVLSEKSYWFLVQNPYSGEYFWTASSDEFKAVLDSGWVDRGVRYCPRFMSENVPVYRLYNRDCPDMEGISPHYYTRDAAERDYLISLGWDDEGVSSYSGPETEEDLATILEVLKVYKTPTSDEIPDLSGFGSSISVDGKLGVWANGDLQGVNIPADADIKVSAKPLTSGSVFKTLSELIGDKRVSGVYDIDLQVDGQYVHDGFGELVITLPLEPKCNGHVIVVHHLHQEDASISTIRSVAKDGYVSFAVTSLSAFAMEDTGLEVQTMYRLYNPNSGEHFYTASASERDAVVSSGWNDEGVGWIAPKTSAVPVYRLYSGTDHHYTMSVSERDDLVRAGWKLEGDNPEGIAWYSDDAETVPLYRQFNPNVEPTAPTNNSGSHNYTTSLNEHKSLVAGGWQDENVGWYAVAAG